MVEVVLGSFARHALHRHMYDYLGAIQCQSGVFPNFAFNVRGRSLARLQGTLINTFLTIEGPSTGSEINFLIWAPTGEQV